MECKLRVHVHSSIQPTPLSAFFMLDIALASIQWWAKAYACCHGAYNVVWDRNWWSNHKNDYRITNQSKWYEGKELVHVTYNEGTDLDDQKRLSKGSKGS